LKSWFLRSSGVIPVYRREETHEKMDQNVLAFDACYRALERGETIGIFPEGTSDMLRKVKKVKTGAARIILEAERRNSYSLGVKVLPVGLYFFSRSRFRSRVLVNIGRPIDLEPFIKLNQQDNREAVEAFTHEIQDRLEKITVNIRHEELDPFVRDLEVLFQEDLKKQSLDFSVANKTSSADFFLTQKIAECVEYYYEHDRQRVQNLRNKIDAYKRKLKRLHLKDDMLREKQGYGQIFRSGAKKLWVSIPGLPIAAYGILNNAIPYFIAEYIAKKFIDDRTKILTALLIGGGGAFVLFYTAQTVLIWYFWGVVWSWVYLALLPATGFFAIAYLKQVRSEKQLISLSFFMFTNRHLLNKLRRERTRLVMEMNAAREEYGKLMGIETSLKAS
ncbi:1-acyl-sn-glycerol-3-phosphate acyltransferase, partial [bacterium]|nr:1-acyl-sn-glycerol-3-phosphate acyltransferase [bacterium]